MLHERRNSILPNSYPRILLALLAGTCLVSLSALTSCAPIYNDVVLDNKDHFLPCEALPTVEEVEQIVADHQDVIRLIKKVSPGHILVYVDELTCSSRADIVISYTSHQQRVVIERIIDSDTFFGVPYRLHND